jgi:hypothetical protein
VSIAPRLPLVLAAAALVALALLVPVRGTSAAETSGPWVGTPTVTVLDASNARVTAQVAPNGIADVWYEYGTTTSYGSVSAKVSVRSLTDALSVITKLKNLRPETEYHVRLVAEVLGAKLYGGDTRFVTPAVTVSAPEPAPSTSPADETPATSAPSPAPAPAPESAIPTVEVPAPAPAQGTAVVADEVGGHIRVKTPGGGFKPLSDLASVPVGSVVDARDGTIALSSETSTGTQTGQFRGALFQVRQSRKGGGMTELHLKGGSFAACRPTAKTVARAAGKRRKPVRRLWGKDKGGRFRTHGRDSVATVRGTTWTVADRCDGTVTRVSEGAVMVRDRHTGRRTLVRAGQRHFARHR